MTYTPDALERQDRELVGRLSSAIDAQFVSGEPVRMSEMKICNTIKITIQHVSIWMYDLNSGENKGQSLSTAGRSRHANVGRSVQLLLRL